MNMATLYSRLSTHMRVVVWSGLHFRLKYLPQQTAQHIDTGEHREHTSAFEFDTGSNASVYIYRFVAWMWALWHFWTILYSPHSSLLINKWVCFYTIFLSIHVRFLFFLWIRFFFKYRPKLVEINMKKMK